MSQLIIAENLIIELPSTLIRVPDFKLNSGEVIAVIGPNGSGKSTLLRAVGGFIPFRGELRAHPSRYLMDENLGYDSKMRAIDLLRLVSALSGERGLNRWIQHFSLSQQLRKRLGELSRGWRKRVLLCAAMLSGAELLLLDEPLDGLDEEGIKQLRGALSFHLRRGGGALLTSPSDIPEELNLKLREIRLE